MLAAVLGMSLLPLLVSLAGGQDRPFLTGAGLRFGLAVGYFAFLAVGYSSLLKRVDLWKLALGRLCSWTMFLALLGYLDLAVFSWSTRYIDVSVAAVLWELWPLVMILFLHRLIGSGRYRRFTLGDLLLLGFGFAGFGFVVAGQSGGFGELLSFTASLGATLLGVALALAAVVLGSLAAFGYRWGLDLKVALPAGLVAGRSPASVDLFCVIFATLLANCVAVPLNLAVGLTQGERADFDLFGITILGGALAYAMAGITWRKANLDTDNLGINGLAYLVPVLSLAWLFLLSRVGVELVDYLIIGAAAIVASNLLINFQARQLAGYQLVLVSVWAGGVLAYLREAAGWLRDTLGWG